MFAIPIIFALVGGEVKPFVGVEMLHSQCLSTSQTMMADFHKKYGYEIKGIVCAEPKRVHAILNSSRV